MVSKTPGEVEQNKEKAMIASFIDELQVAVEVWPVGALFSVSIHDLEADEYLPSHRMYPTAAAAVAKAQEISAGRPPVAGENA